MRNLEMGHTSIEKEKKDLIEDDMMKVNNNKLFVQIQHENL